MRGRLSTQRAPGAKSLADIEAEQELRVQEATWRRFSRAKTNQTGGRTLFRQVIPSNYASLTVPAPCTHRTIAEEIATQAQIPIPIERLSDELDGTEFPRGRAISGRPGDEFDTIALNYPNLQWWVSDSGLNMEVIHTLPLALSDFDQFVGKLMFEAGGLRLSSGRLPKPEYVRIADQIDAAGFRPIDHLEGRDRKRLAEGNKKYSRIAIHTFRQAYQHPNFRRAVLRRLSRAKQKW